MASKKMKQLQWDKVSKTQLQNTIWSEGEAPVGEEELVERMKAVNIWNDMENEFKAREVVYDAVKKKKETELLSVLSPDHRKRIEILMAGSAAKNFKAPEKLSDAIANFSVDLCTETFLHELQGVLPNSDDRGKLLTHSADSEAELELLHPADRLMVRLIQLPHLGDRVKGMLFQVRFQQNVELLQKSLDLLVTACHDIRYAKKFQHLLNVILTMGNYLNGTNFAGGAYGFKIGSINKLVDTKSSNGQNLLHFLERTVSQHFSELQGFIDELAKPSEANRVSFTDMQSTSKNMLVEIRTIRHSLEDNFQDSTDGYARKMFRFSATAEEDLQALRDGILNAEKSLRDTMSYYGEGEEHGRPMQSQDFFGIFRTFTSSYKFCQQQNRARAEEVALRERRAAARAALTPQATGTSDTNLMDARLQRLKLEGTPRVKRERRMPQPPASPLPANIDFGDFMLSGGEDQTVDFGSLAQKMMMNIFDSPAPETLTPLSDTDGPASPTSPSPHSVSYFPEAPTPLLGDTVLERPEEEREAEEADELESRRSRKSSLRSPPSSRGSQHTPSKRSSAHSHRSSTHSHSSSIYSIRSNARPTAPDIMAGLDSHLEIDIGSDTEAPNENHKYNKKAPSDGESQHPTSPSVAKEKGKEKDEEGDEDDGDGDDTLVIRDFADILAATATPSP